jgi:hypothetical protein
MQPSLQLITVDVSNLEPPEPMTVILTQLANLSQQACLLVKHRRQPFPLYEKLNDAGFSYYCVVHAQDDISLYIFHQTAQKVFDEMLLNNNIKKGDN